MREIKFRAWDESVMIYNVGLTSKGRPLEEEGESFWEWRESINTHVMQYTGLKDKNGKEIYEGDILDFEDSEWGGKLTPEVVEWNKIIGNWDMCGSLADLCEWRQVIGNIYENPELIAPKAE